MNNLKQQVKFIPDQKALFFPTLKKKVDAYFAERNISKHANAEMFFKSVCLISLYLIPFIIFLFSTPAWPASLGLWALMGIGLAGIGMSVMHDANHGAYSSNKYVNNLMGYTLNMVGGSVFNWKLQHNILHHTYTNITHIDDDIEDRLVLKFSPHTRVKWFHRFQWLYAMIFYGLLTFYWALLKDFVQYVQFSNNGVNPNTGFKNVVILLRIVAIKAIYFFAMIVAPVWYFHIPFMQVFSGFMLMHFISGIILTTVFQLAHTLENTDHPMPDPDGIIHNDWAIHQMHTTVNFSRENKWLSWYVGGLNFQIEHHLFPKISHVHYPAISEIVKETAKEFNIPYLENKTFGSALASHFRYLKQIGRLPSLNDAIG